RRPDVFDLPKPRRSGLRVGPRLARIEQPVEIGIPTLVGRTDAGDTVGYGHVLQRLAAWIRNKVRPGHVNTGLEVRPGRTVIIRAVGQGDDPDRCARPT